MTAVVRKVLFALTALSSMFTVSLVTANMASAATSPKNTIVLSGNAVGSVRFGEPQTVAVAALVKLIGKSEGGLQQASEGNCIISSALYWSNFAAFFYRGKFDGYQTGSISNKPEPTFNGITPQGLRVGFTLAQAQKLYGPAISTSGEQGGVYAAATKTGTIRGYLSGEPDRVPATEVKLQTISAGSVGCPAMSPG
jgi:hypothetical protein